MQLVMKTKIIFSEKCLGYGAWHIEGPQRVKMAHEILKENLKPLTDAFDPLKNAIESFTSKIIELGQKIGVVPQQEEVFGKLAKAPNNSFGSRLFNKNIADGRI